MRVSRNLKHDPSGVRESNGSIVEIKTTGRKWASVRVGGVHKFESSYRPDISYKPNVDTLGTNRDSSLGQNTKRSDLGKGMDLKIVEPYHNMPVKTEI